MFFFLYEVVTHCWSEEEKHLQVLRGGLLCLLKSCSSEFPDICHSHWLNSMLSCGVTDFGLDCKHVHEFATALRNAVKAGRLRVEEGFPLLHVCCTYHAPFRQDTMVSKLSAVDKGAIAKEMWERCTSGARARVPLETAIQGNCLHAVALLFHTDQAIYPWASRERVRRSLSLANDAYRGVMEHSTAQLGAAGIDPGVLCESIIINMLKQLVFCEPPV